ncbi:MAG: ATP synthase F1 subunit gamma [Candidatus Melainabacteria bacterium]
MPNLKDIRNRIKSVKSTEKITQAMKMVAAAKVKRAENRMKASRPYALAISEVMTKVYNELKNSNHAKALSGSRYAELLAPRPVKRVGLLVISSDRGLCGSYNANVIKQAFRLEKSILAQGLTPKFYLVGNKAIQAFRRYSESPVLGELGNVTAAPSIHDANAIAEALTQAFLNDEIDTMEVLSTDFISMISYRVHMTSLVPVKGKLPEHEPRIDPSQGYVHEHIETDKNTGLRPELLLEPDPVATLDKLLPMYLGSLIYTLMLEASASELAARMSSMSNATKNAKEMIGKLTVVYNKARQASITQEILEVVSGAQALG